MNIDFSLLITAEARKDADLKAAKAAARSAAVTMIDTACTAITGQVPLAEMLSWSAKESAARAVLAQEATAEETDMVAFEAALTGEKVEVLAATITHRADTYRRVIAAFTGLRRLAETAIDAATSPQEVDSALTLTARKIAAVTGAAN